MEGDAMRIQRGANRVIHVLLTVSLFAVAANAQYSGGSGTADDPYQIATAADLIALGKTPDDYDKQFILTADIDLDPNLPGGKVFGEAVIAPLEKIKNDVLSDPPFIGIFDGNDHSVNHMTITSGHYLGLFGALGPAGKITDLAIDAATIDGTGGYVGSLVGYNFGTISNCHGAGVVDGSTYVGGLVGYSNAGSIVNCTSAATVGNGYYLGGLLGYNHNGSVTNCYSAGIVTGKDDAGGLVGYNGGTVINCGNTGMVSGSICVGGLVGDNSNSIINSYSTSAVAGNQKVGGLTGSNGDCLINCYSTGSVVGASRVGGLAGYSPGKVVISCFWDTETSGRTTSACGTGLTTAQMQDIETYLDAGWDLVDESLHGTCDYWQLARGQYPMLRYLMDEEHVLLEGSGTADDPYLIGDARDLGRVWTEPQAHYRLADSLDLTGIDWSMAVIPWFGGFFDGDGYAISHLHIQGEHYLGLIGELASGGTVSRLGLEDVDINGAGPLVGSVAGSSYGRVIDCNSTGTLAGEYSVGGLVGASGGEIANSFSTATVGGIQTIGGLAGYSTGSITHSHSTGTVSGDKYLGGLVGSSYTGNIIVDCYSTGTVNGEDYLGGLLGGSSGSVTSSYIITSYSTGAVSGTKHVGGLVGYNRGSIIQSHSAGAVTAMESVGGLAGTSSGSIANSYSTGKVNGVWDVGGMLGSNTGEVLASFWDTLSSSHAFSGGGTGKTTTEMQMVTTFLKAGWDFIGETANGTEDIWWIDEGNDYPRLWWEALEE